MHKLVNMGKKLCDQERISAQHEEVIMDTDLVDLEDLCSGFGQHFFKGCSWDDKGYRFRYRWVFEEDFVDFPRGDLLPAAIDDFLVAAHEKQIPFVVEKT